MREYRYFYAERAITFTVWRAYGIISDTPVRRKELSYVFGMAS